MQISRTGFHYISAIYHEICTERIIEVSCCCNLALSTIASFPRITAKTNAEVQGQHLPPLIIWPTSTHRSFWTTHPTYARMALCSFYHKVHRFCHQPYWMQHVFDPITKDCVDKRPRVLINDGFGAHESVEILKFCHVNSIILCRLPSRTSHKLQPVVMLVCSDLSKQFSAKRPRDSIVMALE